MHRKDTASSPHAPHYKPIQHPTGLVQHSKFQIPHSTFSTLSTLHIINPSPPAKRSASICRAGGVICVIDKQSEWHLCRSEIRGRNILVPHGPFQIQHSTFHILNIPPPNLHCFFPVAPRLAPKYAILAHLCNHLTFSRLPFEGPIQLSPLLIQPCG